MRRRIPNIRNILRLLLVIKIVSADYKCPNSDGRFKYGVGPNCRKYYECVKNSPAVKTCPDNQGFRDEWKKCVWEGFVTECQVGVQAPLCGQTPEEDQTDKRIESPWMVGVYQRDRTDSEWEYASPGVIVGPTTIIT
ncbi:unnamed protein product, partial [Allacma fusca]